MAKFIHRRETDKCRALKAYARFLFRNQRLRPNATNGPLCRTRATEKCVVQTCLDYSIPEGDPVRVFEFENRWFRQVNRDVPDPFDPNSRRLDR